jgi:hypothetical protein
LQAQKKIGAGFAPIAQFEPLHRTTFPPSQERFKGLFLA